MNIPSEQALLDVALDDAVDRAFKKMLRYGALVCEECLIASLARTLAADVFPVLKAEYQLPRFQQYLSTDEMCELIDTAAGSALNLAACRRCTHIW
jgi:hypothetical protein